MDKNTKIAILGAGVEGLAAAEYFVKKGYKNVTVFDRKDNIEGVIPPGANIALGSDFLMDDNSSIYDYEVLFRSPGIHTSKLKKAREEGLKVTSTTQYFLENCPGKVIGITGTKGKGTTATLIYRILKKHGMDVYLGGNIGESPLTFLDKMDEKSVAVLELSSFQLQDATLSPQISVVLMTTSEHLDYHADQTEYREAKKPICMFQGPEDICILNKDYKYADEFAGIGEGRKFFVSREEPMYERDEIDNGAYIKRGKIYYVHGGSSTEICEVEKVGLLGGHNLENVLAAVVAAACLKVPTATIRKTVYEFKGLEHRLEFVREVKGVRFYNDSFSTTPETSIAAAYAFKGPVMLIAGGSEKHADYSDWGKALQKNRNMKCVFLIGMMAERMEKSLRQAAIELKKMWDEKAAAVNEGKPEPAGTAELTEEMIDEGVAELPLKIFRCSNLEDAVKQALEQGVPGDNVVLSPAAASFDMFKNYKYRGKAFKEIVNNLKGVL